MLGSDALSSVGEALGVDGEKSVENKSSLAALSELFCLFGRVSEAGRGISGGIMVVLVNVNVYCDASS